jgi:GNAT superfamily N-acetyltransferase
MIHDPSFHHTTTVQYGISIRSCGGGYLYSILFQRAALAEYTLMDFSLPTFPTMAHGIFLLVLVFIFSVFYLDAFLPDPTTTSATRSRSLGKPDNGQPSLVRKLAASSGKDSDNGITSSDVSQDSLQRPLTHSDIVWKVRPPPETSLLQRLWLRFAANLIRLDCKVFRKEPPVVLCPKGGQALLEAHCRLDNNKLTKVGRFGFTTERGPPAPPIQETVQDLYGITTLVGVGAIIYMYVEPPYRKRNVGAMALEVISLIHAIQGIDFTVLVVDDDGSGKLIDWYTQHGYGKAPKLQDILGSPNAQNGITMIAPTNRILPHDCRIQWW